MKMTLNQTKLVGLTMELELKAKEYAKLCKDLDVLKETGIDPNAPELKVLKKLFEENLKEITALKNEIKKLQED